MMTLRRLHRLIVLLVCASPLAGPAARAADPLEELERRQKQLFERIAPSVVFLSTEQGFGTGFAVARGLVLTSAHVIGNARRVRVVLRGGRELSGEVVERAGEKIDLALIAVAGSDEVPPLPIGDPAQLRVGSWVASVGHGRGAIWAFNTGMVSNLYASANERPIFQTQIPLNPGSSGAPVVDRLGRVVGVVTAGIRDASSLNFAIKIDVASRSLRRMAAVGESLTILAPPGTAVYLDGVLVGSGSRLVVRPQPGRHEVSAVVGGMLKRVSCEFPRDRSLDLRR